MEPFSTKFHTLHSTRLCLTHITSGTLPAGDRNDKEALVDFGKRGANNGDGSGFWCRSDDGEIDSGGGSVGKGRGGV